MKFHYKIHFNIDDFTKEELCEIYHDLNTWKWAPLLGEKPDWWDNSPDYLVGRFKNIRRQYIPNKEEAIHHIVKRIEYCIGRYKLLEYHWVHNLGRTKEEYKEWILSALVN